MSKKKPEKDKKTGRFVTGNIGGGRSKGSRNKLGEAFLSDMLADWEENGVAAIEVVRAEKPDAYLKVIAQVIPKELNVKVGELDELTDEQLARRFAAIASQLADYGITALGGDAAPQEAQQVGGVPTIQ